MRHDVMVAAVAAALFVAAPAAAQQGEMAADTTEPAQERTDAMAADTTEPTEEEMDEVVDEAEEAAEEAADAPPTHDWEFALAPSSSAPDGNGMVEVTEEDAGSSYRIAVTGLPQVDSLDSEERDVNAYTVWVVPSSDRVAESTLAGVLDVGPEGSGAFTGTTDLDTFGIVVTATPDGAPARIGGVPVLTGIPVTSEPSAEEVEGGEPPAPEADGEPAPEPEPGPEEEMRPNVPPR